MLSVIIPANNEAEYIGTCLGRILDSEGVDFPVEVIVVANACRDATVSVARGFEARAAAKGWRLIVLDRPEPGKLGALNAGDAAASGNRFVYIDADIIVSPRLIAQLGAVLDRPDPAYASGRPVIGPARSRISRAYARIWQRVPFMTEGVPGCGVYAVNAAGRARWKTFPEIISDDTFIRLQFAPHERFSVPALYQWPIVEGFSRLVRVRRRQDIGVAEIERLYPELLANDDKLPTGPRKMINFALKDPIGFATYALVACAVKLPAHRGDASWVRGR